MSYIRLVRARYEKDGAGAAVSIDSLDEARSLSASDIDVEARRKETRDIEIIGY